MSSLPATLPRLSPLAPHLCRPRALREALPDAAQLRLHRRRGPRIHDAICNCLALAMPTTCPQHAHNMPTPCPHHAHTRSARTRACPTARASLARPTGGAVLAGSCSRAPRYLRGWRKRAKPTGANDDLLFCNTNYFSFFFGDVCSMKPSLSRRCLVTPWRQPTSPRLLSHRVWASLLPQNLGAQG